MRNILFLSLVFAGVFFCSIVNSYAASNKEENELSERCGKQADELFTSEYGNGTIRDNYGLTMVSYTNHYNRKMSKCFVLFKSVFTLTNSKKDSFVWSESLFDINENKEYGSFSILNNDQLIDCELIGNFCKSEAQWKLLIKPYMEE